MTGWIYNKDAAKWNYVEADGSLKKSEWFQDGKFWYYLNEKGEMLTGFQTISGKKWYFNEKRYEDIPTGACLITDQSGAINLL